MAKYVYIVTRIVMPKKKQYGTSIPNLGVHSSLNKALGHFNDVKQDRIKRGYERCYDHYPLDDRIYKICRLENANEVEELRLERWNYTK